MSRERKGRRRFVISLLLATVLAVAAAGPAKAAEKKISFLANYALHGRHAPFFLGADKGFYKEAGFDVSVLPTTGSGFVITAIDGNKAEFGLADSTSLVQAIAKGAKVKAFAVYMDRSTSGLASLTPYPTIESIVGKKIAASVTDGTRTSLPVLFAMHGLDPAGINYLAADPSTYYALIFSGQADMFSASLDGDIPTLTKMLAPQGKQIYFAGLPDWGYGVFGYLLVAKAERIAQDPAEVRAFAAATIKAARYAVEHPEETADIMVKHNPTLDRGIVLAQWRQSMKAMDTPYVVEHGYGNAGQPRIAETIALVEKALKIDAKLAPEDVFAEGFVPSN